MCPQNNSAPPDIRPAWRIIAGATAAAAWDGIFLAMVMGIVSSSPNSGGSEPSGWRLGVFVFVVALLGGGLAGFLKGVNRVRRRSAAARPTESPPPPTEVPDDART
jgi:hypothetical protein